MKNSIFKSMAAVALAVSAIAPVAAKAPSTAYFMENYLYRYRLNPAYANDNNFVAMPGLGKLGVNVDGSLSVKDVLYNVNGKTTTFLNPGVSTSEALGNIGDSNRFGLGLDVPVIAFGFTSFGGYNSVTLSAKADVDIKLPGSVFRLLKEGISNSTYDIGNIDGKAVGYAELAFNHSRKINDEFRVGASLKVLIGAGRVNIDIEHADMVLGENDWQIVTEGKIESSVKGLKYKTDYNNTTKHQYVSGAEVDNAGVNGFGLGVDLGVVYTPAFMKELTISASLIDLGFMKWNNNMLATTDGQRLFNTDKYTFNVDKDAPNNFSDELDKMGDELSALYELYDKGDQGGITTGLGATFSIGADYKIPVYQKLSVGLLNTTRVNGNFSWTDFRLIANWEPVKLLGLAASCSAGTYGASFGWIGNFRFPGVNLFVGMDKMFTKIADGIPVPLSSNANFNFGLNFTF